MMYAKNSGRLRWGNAWALQANTSDLRAPSLSSPFLPQCGRASALPSEMTVFEQYDQQHMHEKIAVALERVTG